EYTVIGDTVNTAARLLSGKGSNRFVISDQSHVFLRDKFDFKRLKPLRVKGKRNLQKRYQPVKKIREELYKFPFVGRENEITKIRKEIISGNSLITVQGDPGIGKSRLIYELEKVLPDYVKVYHGSSEEIKGSYHIFATLIRNEAGFSFEDLSEIKKRKLESYVKGIAGGNDQLLRRIPFLGKMLFNLDYSNSIYDKVPVSLRFENLSEAIRLIVNSSKWKKQVVILDDIQWITKKDMDLINYLIHVTSIEPHPSPRSSFILLSRYDPDIIKFLNVPRGLRRTDILLGSLKEVDVKKMTARFLNNKVIPEEVARFLNKRSEGNPFYVEQFLLNLIERGALTEQKRSWVKTSLYKEEEFPENIWSAVMARVDRLEMVAKECLRVGSVIGIEFPEKILKGIINKDLKLSLDLTEREGLLFKVLIKEAEYMFRHTILKDVVYNSILLERQKRLHFSVAKFIERIYANDIERFFGDLAYHYNHAGEWGKSLEYSMKAGDSAAEQFREDDAAMYYKKGIWILENKFRDRKDLLCEQYEKLGKVMDRTGNPAEAERYFKKMVKTVPGNLKVKASSYMARAWVEEHRANYRKSKELFKTAISIFEKMKLNTSLRMKYASLLNFTGWVYCVTGELEKSGQVLKKGLDVIAKIKAGNEKVKREVKGIRAELLNHLGMLFFTRGYPVKALETHKQRLEIETELGRLAGLAGVKGNIGVIYHETGDYDTGHKYYTESLEINKKLGHKRGTAFCLHNLCLVEMARGDYEQGYIYAKETLEYCLELGERNLEAKVYGSFAEYFQYKNNLRKALEYNKKQIAILEDTGNVHVLAESYNSIGELLQFMRRFNEAYKYQEKALAISRKAGNKRQEGISLRNIGIILANQKKRKQGFSYLLKAREMLERLGNKYYVNSTVHAMLEIKFEEKDYNAAEKYAYESLSISREIGFKHAEVMALQFLGKINSEQGRKEEAEKYFKEADDLVK
ncbi:MAG TPA: tetratricopeptide repeat protein, partial [Firmicutes bacterium]|nr:tetratricopeptide repeat protein [Bacillota bacterium]